MKIREILVEYQRDITAQRMGKKLLDAIINSPDFMRIGQLLNYFVPAIEPLFRAIYNNGGLDDEIGSDLEEIWNARSLDIINAALRFLESKDPTNNKQYTPWLARTIINNPGQNWEDLNRDNFLGLYHIGKQRRLIRPEHADINKFATYDAFEDVMWSQYNHYELETKVPENRGEAKEIYKDKDVRVIQPIDQTAACHYGKGTRWCTSATRGDNYFDHYNQQGPLYILIPTEPSYTGEKYQVHFPTDQFMNEQDYDVGFDRIRREFPGFFQYLADIQYPPLQMIIDYTPAADIQNLQIQTLDSLLAHIETNLKKDKLNEFNNVAKSVKRDEALRNVLAPGVLQIYLDDYKKYHAAEVRDLALIENFITTLKEYPTEKLRELFKTYGFQKITRWHEFIALLIEDYMSQRPDFPDTEQSKFFNQYRMHRLVPPIPTIKKSVTDWLKFRWRR